MGPVTSESDSSPTPPPLRPPRPFLAHWVVDAAIAFLVVLFPLLVLGADLRPWGVAAALVGLAVAPVTQRLEAEGLAKRAAARGEEGASGNGSR
jgi:hypothetical protein